MHYSETFVSTRVIQLTKDEIVSLTGLSKDAVKLHIKYLKETGLLESRPAIGSHAGWEYEIFVPEEIEAASGEVGVNRDKTRQSKAVEHLPLHSEQNLPLLTSTNPIENKELNQFPKTLLKTNTIDDEAFAPFIRKFQSAAEELTGENLTIRDAANLEKIADLLILELKIAARRTGGVSSVPAFLSEVLRRQLSAARQHQPYSSKSSKAKPDTVGKPNQAGDYEIKPLDEKGREAALEQLREFTGDAFLQDFKKWYTPDDWTWLMKQLEK